MKSRTTLATNNAQWGFFGTMNEHAEFAWPLAMVTVSRATGEDMGVVRLFLDSRFGRHFADDVHNFMFDGLDVAAAIEAATARWMGWTIGGRTSAQYGIPSDMPYLVGFVVHCSILDEN